MLNSLGLAESAVLAFSGGVDSSFLLKAMQLSGMRFLAVTAFSGIVSEKDSRHAVSFAKEAGAEHLVIHTDELENESFVSNPPERCFFCKEELFRKLRLIAEGKNYKRLFDGTNTDDLRDYRPGLKAAAIYGVRSPLAENGFSKDDIRRMSRELGLSVWNQPSSPCLSSRFPYGRRITISGLRQVERAEEFLGEFGLQELRVRNHGDIARIEVNEKDMQALLVPDNRRKITEALKSLGFSFVALDLEGYISGSMNRALGKDAARKPGAAI
ncbi:MAG: TIGR00268 family protein [Nitrospira bacterium HGW-Nitrospira-1]|nr:MAG: TIGR00268 family protein [Nitrospira bacterium HGW-Nitrospira-1]